MHFPAHHVRINMEPQYPRWEQPKRSLADKWMSKAGNHIQGGVIQL